MTTVRRGLLGSVASLLALAVAAGPSACRREGSPGESRILVVPNIPEIPGPDWERIGAEPTPTPAPSVAAAPEELRETAGASGAAPRKPTAPAPVAPPVATEPTGLPPEGGEAALTPSAGLGPPYELRLTATARQVWLWISVDGGPRRAISLERGEEAQFRATRRFVLTVDDAGGVKAALNGRPLPPLGKPAQARRDLVIPSPELAPTG
jgi:hypothetical protein